ncbi:MAG: septum formation protein Maf [Gammaproteobacteria bacterium]|nr:MAG: septum formation protein Maf [Gammaproteobacteria bacterium]
MAAPHPDNRPDLILASGSVYRKDLLKRIKIEFESISPDINEASLEDEIPGDLALRLAQAKAEKIARLNPTAIVIGSDQVAALGRQLLGKPGDPKTAARQLAMCSGKAVIFHTAVCVRHEEANFAETHVDLTTVNFRELSAAEIEAYISTDKPWDCAGSFKSEGLGPALFESIDNQDPSAIIGLPMIWLTASLRRAGLSALV